jgi:putative NIF3 family GTP cyclohydrolase 1 type 2
VYATSFSIKVKKTRDFASYNSIRTALSILPRSHVQIFTSHTNLDPKPGGKINGFHWRTQLVLYSATAMPKTAVDHPVVMIV